MVSFSSFPGHCYFDGDIVVSMHFIPEPLNPKTSYVACNSGLIHVCSNKFLLYIILPIPIPIFSSNFVLDIVLQILFSKEPSLCSVVVYVFRIRRQFFYYFSVESNFCFHRQYL